MVLVLTTKAYATASVSGGKLHNGLQVAGRNIVLGTPEMKKRFTELFTKVELSVSSYDTAWLALIPSPSLLGKPCFPQCLNWLLENQLEDGSWSLPPAHGHQLVVKDCLLSTLASVVALSRWGVSDEHVRKGLNFMKLNIDEALDTKKLSPTGFDILFPGLIEHARDLDLCLPVDGKVIDAMLHKRDLELERVSRINSKASKAYLAYISEGLTKSYDWKENIRYQRKNGSLFNSPSSTAALLANHHDPKCLEYLQTLLEIFGDAVPTVYPINIYIRLSMVDRLKAMGIDRHFRDEIKHVLDETYRCWLERDEEVFLDLETCALAYRLLRTDGYKISSDELAEFEKEECFFSSGGQNVKDISSVLELYRASKITTPDELVSEKLHLWTSRFLKQELLDWRIHDRNFLKEVEDALDLKPDSHLERLENIRSIKSYNIRRTGILKACYRSPNIDNNVFLELAVEDFNFCQCIYQEELKNLERWMTENKLDKTKFARHKLTYAHFFVSSLLSTPDLSDARMSWTKNVVLITIVDSLFDGGGSEEEVTNLVKLFERWDDISNDDFFSEQVKIMFLAIHTTINDLGNIAFERQGRNVTSHMIDTWRALINSMMFEYECGRDKSKVPTLEEYIEHARTSIGTGPTSLILLYLLEIKVSDEVVRSPEYNNLYKYMGTCCRLLNDLQTFKREAAQGKLNSVSLCMIQSSGDLTEDMAIMEVTDILNCNKRDLLSVVLDPLPTIVPKVCKDIFWKTVRVTYYMYGKNDGYSSPLDMVKDLNEVFHERLEVPSSTQGKRVLN